MKYTVRPGILLKEIAGDMYLLASGEAGSICPAIQRLNTTGAFFWRLLEKGTDEETMIRTALREFDAEEAVVRPSLSAFLESLKDHHYLLQE